MIATPTIIKLPSAHYCKRIGYVAIVAHGTQGVDSRGYLQRNDRQVSAHRLIGKDGTIYWMVPDELGANHAGYGTLKVSGATYSRNGTNVNFVTLAFELENLQNGHDPYPEVQLLSMGWQIADWRKRYGALPVVRHADIDPTRRKDTTDLTVVEIEYWTRKAMDAASPVSYRVKFGGGTLRRAPRRDTPQEITFIRNVPAGTLLQATGAVTGEKVNGSAMWIKTVAGEYIHSSAVVRVN